MVAEPFSDHNAITFTIKRAPHWSRISKKYTYVFDKSDWSHLTSLFKYSPWDFPLAGEDINNNWTIEWKDIFFAAVNDCIPKYKQKRKTTAPWITQDLIKLCKKKRNFYKKAKTSRREEAWATNQPWTTHLKGSVIHRNGNTSRNWLTKWNQRTTQNHSGAT